MPMKLTGRAGPICEDHFKPAATQEAALNGPPRLLRTVTAELVLTAVEDEVTDPCSSCSTLGFF